MPSGSSLHIGVSHVDPDVFAESTPARGCGVAAIGMYEIAGERGFANRICLVNEQATRNNVERSLRTLVRGLRDGDVLFLTLAGHVRMRSTRNCDVSMDRVFLLYDSEWSARDIHSFLCSIRVAARVMIVAETCFSGGLVGCDGGESDERMTASILLLAACGADVKADGSHNDSRHPPFTDSLLRSWRDSPTYDDLFARMAATLTTENHPTPLLSLKLARHDSEVKSLPFSI